MNKEKEESLSMLDFSIASAFVKQEMSESLYVYLQYVHDILHSQLLARVDDRRFIAVYSKYGGNYR